MPGHFSLQELLSRARRRELAHLILDKTVLAATVALGGAIILLLAGTDFLGWYWLALLVAASLAVGLYRVRRSIPTLYAVAQSIDRRLKLADALSTALYFGQHPDDQRQAVCERQRQSAEEIARQVDLRAALPLKRSRFIAPAAGLAVAAVALFGLRYMVTGSMSLEPSLIRIAYDSFFTTKAYEAKNQLKGLRPKLDQSGLADLPDAKTSDQERSPDDLNADNPDGVNPESGDSQSPGKNQSQDKNTGKGDPDQKGDQGTSQDAADQNSKSGSDSKSGDQKAADKPGDSNSKGNGNNQNSSLMDKMRDALSNMMNKLKSQDGQQQQTANSKSGPPQGDPADKGQKSSQGKDQKSESSTAEARGDHGDQTDSSDPSDSKSSSKNASSDAKNGIGSQDGEKALQAAQELQAMGKISELLGKRSAAVSGEVMVEVGNSKQPLKTPWSQRQAAHTEAGSEIHRDEVPLIYQPFVQQYFEEIRKAAK